MRLLERESHLSSLAQYAGEARRGQGRMILLAGEAGVGKSSLLEQLERELADARWCWGGCDGLFTPRPLAPLLDIGGQLNGELGELCQAGAPREQLFAALLRQLSAPGTLTVLAIEDVHWADEATLDLLRFIGRRIRDAQALIVVTYRDDGLAADDPLRIALGELSTQRTTRRLGLPPLSEEAVAHLADGSGVEPSSLHKLTGGNPFFVTEALQSTGGDLPTSVRDAVLGRVVGLSADVRHVLDLAALIGSRMRPEFLQSVAGASPANIDELVGCGVMVGDGGRLRFRHEIARMAVQAAIAPHRMALAHRSILDTLLVTSCDDDARLAFHAQGAGDDARVLEFAPRAGRRASELAAHREAAAQFERALRSAVGADADARTVASLYDELAHELALVDRWQDSADARQGALRLWRELRDRLREGDSLRRLSRTMWRLCRGDDAERASVDSLGALEPLGPSPELAWAYANLANHRLNRGEYDAAIPLARQARIVAEPLGLSDVLSDALNTEACASAGLGAVWSPLLHRSLEIAKASRLDEQAGRAYANLYSLYTGAMKIADGEGIFVEGIAYCDEHDIATFGTCLRGERSSVMEKLGRWDEAESLAEALLQQVGPSPVNRRNPLLSLGKLRARRGDE
ncbi:MAG: AAA family ATPase, partial [Nocardioidaceae bacterium]